MSVQFCSQFAPSGETRARYQCRARNGFSRGKWEEKERVWKFQSPTQFQIPLDRHIPFADAFVDYFQQLMLSFSDEYPRDLQVVNQFKKRVISCIASSPLTLRRKTFCLQERDGSTCLTCNRAECSPNEEARETNKKNKLWKRQIEAGHSAVSPPRKLNLWSPRCFSSGLHCGNRTVRSKENLSKQHKSKFGERILVSKFHCINANTCETMPNDFSVKTSNIDNDAKWRTYQQQCWRSNRLESHNPGMILASTPS